MLFIFLFITRVQFKTIFFRQHTAIAQTLPGLESFLKEVLGNEPLSSDAEKQRLEFLRRLESISAPPSLPPRPPDLGLRRRLAQQDSTAAGSQQHDDSDVAYRNEGYDPVQFASKQRDLARTRTYSTRREITGDEGNDRGGGLEYTAHEIHITVCRSPLLTTSAFLSLWFCTWQDRVIQACVFIPLCCKVFSMLAYPQVCK